MKAFRKKPQISRTEALNRKPIKNTEIQETLLETGEVLLIYSINVRPWATTLMRRLGGSSNQAQNKKLQLGV